MEISEISDDEEKIFLPTFVLSSYSFATISVLPGLTNMIMFKNTAKMPNSILVPEFLFSNTLEANEVYHLIIGKNISVIRKIHVSAMT